ncbi:arylsulfatase A-like enzyme [Jejuia pallidilutea]|uniref:Arylsulfatase A-like enzyme n=1 Tax=Jejuia pallidilutea TaxID=504487 RepID=A0A362X079_9FLAO|nr:sulfatase-like hydrolase/transferase [Jejuia pallidilutea]PQV48394.1 arylsulfatase A-like enzyme [Jejuia pallidilutea]
MCKKFYIFFLLLNVLGTISSQNSSISLESAPNIIIILADDLGFKDVGFNGCEDIPTPNIDKIASQGVKFTNAYVTYAVCGPSRAGLITGRYQDRFGFGRNPLFAPNDPNMGLPLTEETLASALKKANYKSIALGKWHLGAHESLRPLRRGFDDFYGFLSGGHQYFPELWTLKDEYEVKAQFDAYKTKLLRDNERVEEKEYLTDALSREAVNYIEKYKMQPFFMYLAYNAPHTPLQATDKYLNRFTNIKDTKRKTYAAMVSAMDDGVGLILNKLETLGLAENTIVFFLSDNGGPENHNASNNGVLRDGKGSLFEGGIHVPFAMKWPNKISAGLIYNAPVLSLDIFATAIAQAPVAITTKNQIDGVNLVPFLTGKNTSNPHEYMFWRKFDAHNFATRDSFGNKMIFIKANNMLFNLKQNISETENLIETHPETFNHLKQKYDDWKSKMLDPIFLGLNTNEAYNKTHPNRFVRDNNQKQ